MKKLVIGILCAGMVLSSAACGGNSSSGSASGGGATAAAQTEAAKLDPKEVYSEAMKKNAELKSMDMSMDINMDMKMGEESMEMAMEMDMKADGYKTDDIKCLITNTTSAQGESIEMTMFYTDGYYYMDAMGQKVKYAMDAADMSEQAASSAGMGVDVAWMSDISLEDKGEDKHITFTGDPSKMDSFVEEILASSGSGMEGMEMTLKSVSGECLVGADGYLKSENLTMEIEVAAQGQTASMVMEMTVVYNNPGQPVTIELPSTDGYTEVDASALQQ